MKYLTLLLLFLSAGLFELSAQTIVKPNFAVGSHPVTVDKISRTDSAFVIQITLENKLPNGYFCAGKDIVLKDITTGKLFKMKYSKGIPVCPDVYHFKWIGEKLTFSFYFPVVDTAVHFVNLVENCKENCLVINGLILDSTMNALVNQGFDAYTHENLSLALESFQLAIDRFPDYPYGFLYGNVIRILLEEKKVKEAKNQAVKLRDSQIIDKYSILKQIEKEKDFSIE